MKAPILGCFVCVLALGTAEARLWTGTNGLTVEAEMLGLESGKVIVQLPNRTRAGFTVSNLSPSDQAWVQAWTAAKSPTEVLPLPLWPDAVQQPEIHVKKAPPSGGDFVFQSPHYEFICDTQVSESVMNDFATVAEGTVRLLESLPIHWPSAEGRTFHARILQNRARYQKFGGPQGSSGVYITGDVSGEGLLLVPFESLGIEKFAGQNTKSYGYSATVLIHEMVHQATGSVLVLTPRWVAEGMAEYGANMTYRNGVFYFTERDRVLALHKHLEFYDNMAREIIAKHPESAARLPASWVMHPSDLIKKPESSWNTAARSRSAQIELHRMYISSMFLMYYFLHFADNGEARHIRVYFDHLAEVSKSLQSTRLQINQKTEQTLEGIRTEAIAYLLGTQPLQDLDADFHRRFAALGFRIGE